MKLSLLRLISESSCFNFKVSSSAGEKRTLSSIKTGTVKEGILLGYLYGTKFGLFNYWVLKILLPVLRPTSSSFVLALDINAYGCCYSCCYFSTLMKTGEYSLLSFDLALSPTYT
jgi:hypothetical protein